MQKQILDTDGSRMHVSFIIYLYLVTLFHIDLFICKISSDNNIECILYATIIKYYTYIKSNQKSGSPALISGHIGDMKYNIPKYIHTKEIIHTLINVVVLFSCSFCFGFVMRQKKAIITESIMDKYIMFMFSMCSY